MKKLEALNHLRVLEYCEGIAGPYATKILADMGAEVIKVESPGAGDVTRRCPPRVTDRYGEQHGVLFLALNTNKLSITLDLRDRRGRELFRRLIVDSDVLVEDKLVGFMHELGMDYATVSAVNPRIVYTSITSFGQTGPYRHFKMHEGNLSHASGQSWLLWQEDSGSSTPYKVGGLAAEYDCGLISAIAILAATFEMLATGHGQHIDISKQEACMAMERIQLGRDATDRLIGYPHDHASLGIVRPYECRDGYIVIWYPEESQWQALLDLMGAPEWAKQKQFATRVSRLWHAAEVHEHINQWTRGFAKEELYHLCQQHGVPAGSVRDAREIINSRQMRERGFFATIEQPGLGEIVMPGAGYVLSETPFTLRQGAPRLGQHNEEIYQRRLGLDEHVVRSLATAGVI